MKYINQLTIIMGVSFVGEALHKLLALPVPASIYGLIIMMILLESGIVKFENIKDTGTFMLNIMIITFVPSTVGVMTAIEDLKSFIIPILVALFVITFIVMVVTGRVTQFVLERKEKKKCLIKDY